MNSAYVLIAMTWLPVADPQPRLVPVPMPSVPAQPMRVQAASPYHPRSTEPMRVEAVSRDDGQVTQARVTAPIQTPMAVSATLEKRLHIPEELHSKQELRLAHGPDYKWLAGQLCYAHADGGHWLVRYAPISVEDVHGGCVALSRDIVMDKFRDGDFVIVEGEVLNSRASAYLGCPLYRVRGLQFVERPAK